MRGVWVGVLCVLGSLGCVDGEVRPQVLLFVDTDLEVPLRADTLRIDLLDESGAAVPGRTRIVHLDAWPVSFGVAGEPGQRRRFRLRLIEANS